LHLGGTVNNNDPGYSNHRKDDMYGKGFFCLMILCLVFPISGCTTQQTLESTVPILPPTQVPNIPPTQLSIMVTITGWFTTVWNGETHYSITDDQGQTTELLMEDEIAKPLGGPLELDRKRVTITGEIVSDSPRTVRVLSVQFADSNLTSAGFTTASATLIRQFSIRSCMKR
jgi:hypothetical protein